MASLLFSQDPIKGAGKVLLGSKRIAIVWKHYRGVPAADRAPCCGSGTKQVNAGWPQAERKRQSRTERILRTRAEAQTSERLSEDSLRLSEWGSGEHTHGYVGLEETRIGRKVILHPIASRGGREGAQKRVTCERTRTKLPSDFSLATLESGKQEQMLSEFEGKIT